MAHSPAPARLARRLRSGLAALAASSVLAVALAGCSASGGSVEATSGNGGATDSFPVTVEHQYGSTTIPKEPERVVVVGITEQDILLELGVVPIAVTEWYGEQPSATWPWAAELLGGATPTVLETADGFQYEKIASLRPDLIIGTNAGMQKEDYAKLSKIAPTVTNKKGAELYFSDWQDQTRQVAKAVGRSAQGDELITGVADAYAAAAAAHPEFAGLTASFAQGVPYENNLWVYPDGLNTDFLTDLGFTITPGLEQYAPKPGQQAQMSPENIDLIEADVVVFATESPDGIDELLSFGTLANLGAVTENRAVYTDAILSGAIYFLTPLSQKYVIEKLVPRLVDAAAGKAPKSTEG
ncbi:ABC transporter substrate-binding protein [Plantibacter sp. YIM 135347]|uniref:ABC transporter substrate-binding protein n=1 Tax=Plantibacter sp. YIM 135347 TaxID=3423919 RepID=UPI003D341485